MNYFSMFSGIGTGEKGIEQACGNSRFQRESQRREDDGPATRGRDCSSVEGVSERNIDTYGQPECVGFSEIDRHAEAIYRYHYPDHRNYGDAARIICDELPDFDFLIGGFPCQAFSIAGKRQGFDDARGTLFFEIARILSHKRPAHFLLENVKGLLSHDDGKTVHEIFRILTELDYRVELCVLNSKDYGVPQNRERCFFIGHLRERCSREILSIGNGGGGDFEAIRGNRPLRGREKSLGGCLRTRGINQFDRADLDNLIYPELMAIGGTQEHQHWRNDGLSPTLTQAMGTGGGQTPMVAVTDHRRIRRLTPIECERLQGLPDDYTKFGRYGDEIKEVSDTQRYKGLGNAFTVNVIEAIITRMLEKDCIE